MIKVIMSHNPAARIPIKSASQTKPATLEAVQQSLDHLKAHQKKLQATSNRDAIRR